MQLCDGARETALQMLQFTHACPDTKRPAGEFAFAGLVFFRPIRFHSGPVRPRFRAARNAPVPLLPADLT